MCPECLALSPKGKYLFASLGDGRIVRMSSNDDTWDIIGWQTVVRTGSERLGCGKGGPADSTNTESTCGRPLGLWFGKRYLVDPKIEELSEQEKFACQMESRYLMTNRAY